MSKRTMSASAPPFVPSIKTLITNDFHQHIVVTECLVTDAERAAVQSFISKVINVSPHPINYFIGDCPIFSLQKPEDDRLVNMFRPEASQVLYDEAPSDISAIGLYHDSTYSNIAAGSERAYDLNAFLGSFGDLPVILVLSSIGGKNLIEGLRTGVLFVPKNLMIVSPRSALSVRNELGTIIGTRGFNVMWANGLPVGRA